MPEAEFFLWTLFEKLRRRRFALGPEDYEALRQTLRAGFGWSSPEALCDLCCALWAKSRREKEIVAALFAQLDVPLLELPDQPESQAGSGGRREKRAEDKPTPAAVPENKDAQNVSLQRYSGRAAITLSGVQLPERPFVFVPQFPVTHREIAQTWRRLRQPVREGPRTELDVEATVARRSRLGVASPVVLTPRRRNTARLLLLVDRQGSMAPFHLFSDHVCASIAQAGRLERVGCFYFHDVPAEGTNPAVLAPLAKDLYPALDAVLPQIPPLAEGYVYEDRDLLLPQPLTDVLRTHAAGAAVVLISDAGAARGRYDTPRLLDTVAFLKALRAYSPRCVWLNPLPRRYWSNATAAQIARHVPMFPLDRPGMDRAVNVLRGKPHPLERPL